MTKRIALVLPNMAGGGAERVALTLIQGFLERGHEVDLVLMRAEGELMELVPAEARVFDLKARRIRSALWPLVRYLRERRPDAVQASMWPVTIIAIFARLLARSRARLVVSDHALLSDHYPSRATRAAIRMTTRLLYPRADARVAVSRGAAQDLASLSALPVDSFKIIHNPLPLPKELTRDQAVETLWGDASKRILTVGQIKEEKDHACLVRAFARLPRSLNARLVIVGSGPLREHVEAIASELGVTDRVMLAGYAHDPWPYYASADIFALSSREESFGNVLIEAMHAGLPIVSTRSIGALEVLGQGRYGILVEQGNVERLENGLMNAMRSVPDRAALIRRARELSGEGSFDAYLELLSLEEPHDAPIWMNRASRSKATND